MDTELRKKALLRLKQSTAPTAKEALGDEIARAIDVLRNQTAYDDLADALAVLELIGDEIPVQTAAGLTSFIDVIETRPLNYPSAGAFADEIAKYENAQTLIGKAVDAMLRLRYLEPEIVLRTLLSLATRDVKEVKNKALASLKTMASYNLQVFYGDQRQQGVGAAPQLVIVEELEKLGNDELSKYLVAVLAVCEALLSPTIEGTSWTYKAVTISRGTIPSSGMILDVRARTVRLLERIYKQVVAVADKLHVVAVLNDASRGSTFGGGGDAPRRLVAESSLEVLRFYLELANSEPLPVLEKIESLTYWVYYHSTSSDVEEAAFRVRDALSENEEYGIYKTLIGFEGIFGDWVSLRTKDDIEAKDKYRDRKAREFANSVDEASFQIWRQRILTFAAIESNDVATFPVFYKFLEYLAEAKPALALRLVTEDAEPLAPFLVPLLRTLWSSNLQTELRKVITSWVSEGHFLRVVAAQFLDNKLLDVQIVKDVLLKAIERKDETAASMITSVAASNYRVGADELVKDLFSPALEFLTATGSTRWLFDFWSRKELGQLISTVPPEVLDSILKNLLPLKAIDYHAEEVLYYIASRDSQLVLDFLCARIRKEAEEGKRKNEYEAIPYAFHKLQEPLAKNPRAAIDAVRALYDGNYGLFIYRGARLLRIIFPRFPEEFADQLQTLLAQDNDQDFRVLLAVLRTYDGLSAIQPVAKAVIRTIPIDSDLRTEVAVALQSTGVVTGAYGFVQAWERKIEEMSGWLNDSDEKVRVFANWYIESLRKQIEGERRRVDEEIALRKHEYGE